MLTSYEIFLKLDCEIQTVELCIEYEYVIPLILLFPNIAPCPRYTNGKKHCKKKFWEEFVSPLFFKSLVYTEKQKEMLN
jgi:hypothetical protein